MCNVPSPWNANALDALDVEQSRQVLEAASRVVDAVIAAGPEGITKSSLQNMLNLSTGLLEDIFSTFHKDSSAVFWSGYDTARLVAVEFWPSWTIRTRPFELKRKRRAKGAQPHAVGLTSTVRCCIQSGFVQSTASRVT